MALRLASSRSSRLIRPTLAAAAAASTASPFCNARYASNKPDPKTKATSILDALPGSSIASKTGVLSAGAALATIAISNELYVVNEETVILGSFIALVYGIAKAGAPAYAEWADSNIKKIKDVLQSARKNHTEAVQSRIDSVTDMKDVAKITQGLFDVSKETARLEAQTFEIEQRVNFSHEAKSVLDSWVRYESAVRQREQRQLAETLIGNIQKQIKDSTFQRQLLQQSVADVERLVSSKAQ